MGQDELWTTLSVAAVGFLSVLLFFDFVRSKLWWVYTRRPECTSIPSQASWGGPQRSPRPGASRLGRYVSRFPRRPRLHHVKYRHKTPREPNRGLLGWLGPVLELWADEDFLK